MEQYFKIGEISKLYNIGPDSLRYYEELGILTPKRSDNGYRLYRLEDLWRLNVIRDLRRLDFSMDRIKSYLTSRSVATTKELLLEELQIIDQELTALVTLKSNVKSRLHTLDKAWSQTSGVVTETIFPTRRCHMIHSGYDTDEEMDMLIKQLLNKDKNHLYIIGNNRIGSLIPLAHVYEKKYRSYSAVFIIDEFGTTTLESGNYLAIFFRGPSDQNDIYITKLIAYAKKRNLTPVGPVLELLWIDIHQAERIEEHVTELQLRFE